jgi:hypothetical protein
VRRRVCECGASANERGVCDRCELLDGVRLTRASALVFESLRDYRWLSVYELAELTGVSVRSVLRALKRLRAAGRVMSADEDVAAGAPGGFHAYWLRRGWDSTACSTVCTRKVWSLSLAEPRRAA